MHQFLEFGPSFDSRLALFVSLSLGVFIRKKSILLEFKDNNLKGFLLRILFDLKESFQGLNPPKVEIRVDVSFKLKRVKFHVPQVIKGSPRRFASPP